MTDTASPTATPAAPARNFGFGEAETDLRDLARRFLAEQLPATRLRELVAADPESVYERGEPAGWDPGIWSSITDMGWTAVAVPESTGGTPVTTAGLAGLAEEAGRAALPAPLGSTLAAAAVLRRSDGPAARAAMEAIAGGTAATLATTDPTGSWRSGDCGVEAMATDSGWQLRGAAAFVQEAAKSELFVVQCRVADDAAGTGSHMLVSVEAGAPGLTVERNHIHDLTRDQATLRFDGVTVESTAVVTNEAVEVLDAALPCLLTLAAADLCGAAEWLLQTTVAYASDRVQFDRPIGFFQAVKHPLVNVMIDLDRARSLTYHAASLYDATLENAGEDQAAHDAALTAARMAKSAASDAASFAADRAVQLHGGIGFTWEHDAHIWFKRALHGVALLGDGRYQRRHLADALIGPITTD